MLVFQSGISYVPVLGGEYLARLVCSAGFTLELLCCWELDLILTIREIDE
jgi:hypothetical protein